MLGGERIYEDFLQYTPPGTDLVYLLFFRLFGLRLWITNFVVLALGLVFVWLVYSTARKILPLSSAVLASALFLVPIYGNAINSTHHWFGVLAVLAAVRVVFTRVTSMRFVFAGVLLSLASFFSLYHGAAALLAVVVFRAWSGPWADKDWKVLGKDLLLVLFVYLLTLATLNYPYIVSIGIRQLWYFQVTYVHRFAVHPQWGFPFGLPNRITIRTLPSLAQYLIVYLLLPSSTIIALYLCWKRRRNPSAIEPVTLLTFVAFLLLAEVAISVNWLRLFAVSAPSVIVLIWVIWQSPTLRTRASVLLWAWILVQGGRQTFLRQRSQHVIVTLPAGTVATSEQSAARLTLIARRLKPGDTAFHALWPGIYLPFHVHNPMYFETVCLDDLPRSSDIWSAIRQLDEQRVPYVFLAATPNPINASYCGDRLGPLSDYLHVSYLPVETLPDGDTLWRRRQSIP